MKAIAVNKPEIKSKRFEVLNASLEYNMGFSRMGLPDESLLRQPNDNTTILSLELVILDDDFLADLAAMEEFGHWLDCQIPQGKQRLKQRPACAWCGRVYEGEETKCIGCGGPRLE